MTIKTAAAPILLLAALALAGCAGSPEPTSTPVPEATADGCQQVTVVVEYGPLGDAPQELCAEAGLAIDVLASAGIETEGTADYGDQVICRVDGQPAEDEPVEIEGEAPFTETCQTFNSVAYWAMWVKDSPDAEWAYAEEGVTTQELTDGQSLGLVYTAGTDSTPPQG
jgi:hypothetical protein